MILSYLYSKIKKKKHWVILVKPIRYRNQIFIHKFNHVWLCAIFLILFIFFYIIFILFYIYYFFLNSIKKNILQGELQQNCELLNNGKCLLDRNVIDFNCYYLIFRYKYWTCWISNVYISSITVYIEKMLWIKLCQK